jgi:hypothetical protein
MYWRSVSFAFKSFVRNIFLFDEQHVSDLARYEHRTARKSSWEVRVANYWNQLNTEMNGHYFVKAPIPTFSIIILMVLYYLNA